MSRPDEISGLSPGDIQSRKYPVLSGSWQQAQPPLPYRIIPPRSDQTVSRFYNRKRNLIERFFNRIKHFEE